MIFTNLHQHLVSIELKQIDHEIFLKNKISLCTICRELQFEVCNHSKHASPCAAREGECFHRKEKEAGRAIKNRVHDALLLESMPGKKRSLSSSSWACSLLRARELPLLGVLYFFGGGRGTYYQREIYSALFFLLSI